jgi:excisionase family DNA binding protein
LSKEYRRLPKGALPLIRQVLEGLSRGKVVRVVTSEKELTTYQAASLLQVSRPYLVKLLEQGQIPHHMVGTHHRVNLDDLLAYKTQQRTRRKAALAEMTALNQELDQERA